LLSADSVELAPDQLALGALLGALPVYFDVFVYGFAAFAVFPSLFFPGLDPALSFLTSATLVGLAYLVRPVGKALFQHVEREFGLTTRLVGSAILLCVAVAITSQLAGSAVLGASVIWLLAGLRIAQGLALAGIGGGLRALYALGRPGRRISFAALVPHLAAPVALALAGGLYLYSAWGASNAEFLDWGWRFPMLAALAINLVGLVARLRLSAAERLGRLHRQTALAAAARVIR
jgi:MFS family permease